MRKAKKIKKLDPLPKMCQGCDVEHACGGRLTYYCQYLPANRFISKNKKNINVDDQIENIVKNFKTKYQEGFTNDEIVILLKQFPNINMEKFNKAFNGNTCMLIGQNVIHYHCDIINALRCGTENRDLTLMEGD